MSTFNETPAYSFINNIVDRNHYGIDTAFGVAIV